MKFKLDEDSRIGVLEVATCHTFLREVDMSQSQVGQKITTTDAPSASFSL